jgi:hypothetical protein
MGFHTRRRRCFLYVLRAGSERWSGDVDERWRYASTEQSKACGSRPELVQEHWHTVNFIKNISQTRRGCSSDGRALA